MNYGWLMTPKTWRSFMTEWTLLLLRTLAFSISLHAYIFLDFLYCTFQTFPKPPLPMTYLNRKAFLDIAMCLVSNLVNGKKITDALSGLLIATFEIAVTHILLAIFL